MQNKGAGVTNCLCPKKNGSNCFEQLAYSNKAQMCRKNTKETTIHIIGLNIILSDIKKLVFNEIPSKSLLICLNLYQYLYVLIRTNL